MAAGWQVLLEEETPGIEIAGGRGVALLYQQRQIDLLAERLGVTPLSRFFSRSPVEVAEYLSQQGLNPDEYDLPEEEWFSAEDGLATVRALLEALSAAPQLVPQGDKVIADLDDAERILALAALHGVRFHFDRKLAPPEETR